VFLVSGLLCAFCVLPVCSCCFSGVCQCGLDVFLCVLLWFRRVFWSLDYPSPFVFLCVLLCFFGFGVFLVSSLLGASCVFLLCFCVFCCGFGVFLVSGPLVAVRLSACFAVVLVRFRRVYGLWSAVCFLCVPVVFLVCPSVVRCVSICFAVVSACF
jgi:hypothetical protein